MTVPVESKECKGSGEVVLEGESVTFSIKYPAVIDITGGVMSAYLGSNDMSATVLSGSLTGNGTDTLTLKTISNEIGSSSGNEYVYSFGVICQGQKRIFFFRRIVMRKSLR
jgi:hypothetical protein